MSFKIKQKPTTTIGRGDLDLRIKWGEGSSNSDIYNAENNEVGSKTNIGDFSDPSKPKYVTITTDIAPENCFFPLTCNVNGNPKNGYYGICPSFRGETSYNNLKSFKNKVVTTVHKLEYKLGWANRVFVGAFEIHINNECSVGYKCDLTSRLCEEGFPPNLS